MILTGEEVVAAATAAIAATYFNDAIDRRRSRRRWNPRPAPMPMREFRIVDASEPLTPTRSALEGPATLYDGDAGVTYIGRVRVR